MEKIKVNKEMFKALEDVRLESSFIDLFETHAKGFKFNSQIYKPFNYISTIELGKILISGYEIEQTPEEILCEYFSKENIQELYMDNFKSGMHFTLETLGITIKGIND